MHFNWHSASRSGKTPPITLSLKPYQTHLIDVAGLQAQNVLPAEAQWASVFVSIPGIKPDQVLAVAASYDKTGRYGSQTPFNDQLAFHWEGDQWQVDETHNSIITAGNGGTQPVKARLTLFYNGGKDSYEIEQLLVPEEQMWLDVSQLVRTQLRDKNGHTLPTGNASGAYRLEELGNVGVGDLFEGKLILDKTNGESVYGCMICCAPAHGLMDFDPLGVAVSGDEWQSVSGIDACTGEEVGMSSEYTTWWTGDTSIATATMSRIHGVAPGSTQNYARGTVTWGTGDDRRQCRTRLDTASGGTNVGPYQIEPIATASQGPASCPSGQAGWNRNVTNQVQYITGSPYAVSGLTVADIITIGSRHDLGSGTSTGSATTTGDGSFNDNYSVCSTACPASSGETDALQYWTVAGVPLSHANGLVYKCGSITIDGR